MFLEIGSRPIPPKDCKRRQLIWHYMDRRRRDGKPDEEPADGKLFELLVGWCHHYSPLVGWDETRFPETLLVDSTGAAVLFGGELLWIARLLGELAARGLSDVRGAVADTLGAAWAIARFGDPYLGETAPTTSLERASSQSSSGSMESPAANATAREAQPTRSRDSLTVLWAGNSATPEADEEFQFAEKGNQSEKEGLPGLACVWIVPPGRTQDALRLLPIESLRISSETVCWCRRLGLRRIGQLEQLPRGELATRLGRELLVRWDQARGRSPEPFPWSSQNQAIAVRRSLDWPVEDRERLEHVLVEMAQEVSRQLQTKGLGALQLRGQLECFAERKIEFSIGLYRPVASAAYLAEMIALRLERQRLPGPVESVELSVDMAAPLEFHQAELFPKGPTGRKDSARLAELVDRLSNRLGTAQVMRPSVLAESQPELAYQYRPWIQGIGKSSSRPANSTPYGKRPSRETEESSPRPLRLFTPPVAVPVVALSLGGPPYWFRWRGRQYRVMASWGPERIETGWWRGVAVGRDYYQVETEEGARFWLFRRTADGKWFLHGVFS